MMRHLATIGLMALAALPVGCGLDRAVNAVESFDPVISADSFGVVLAGVVLDARTGAPPESNVRISFSGEGAPLVRDVFGHDISEIESVSGHASFALASNVKPSEVRPFEIRIRGEAAGYRTNMLRVALRAPGLHEFRLVLDRDDAPLAPHLRAEATAALTGQTLGAPLIVEAGSSLPLKAVAPAGLRVASGSEAPAAGGSLTVSLESAIASPELFATFPGGMDAGVALESGPVIPASLTSGGVVRVALREGNGETALTVVGQDSVLVTMGLSRFLFNPNTSAAIRDGDQIRVQEWSEATGLWTNRHELRIADQEGVPTVTFPVGASGVFSAGYWNAHCQEARLELAGNTLGGTVVAHRGDEDAASGVRVWRFGPRADQVTLPEPPGLWAGVLVLHHGNEVVRIPYETLCGFTQTVRLTTALDGVQPAPETLLSPAPCTALRVNRLATLAVLGRKHGVGLNPATASLLESPYVAGRPEVIRDGLGRIAAIRAPLPRGTGGRIEVVLGGLVWSYPNPEGGTIHIANMARLTGLCANR